MPPTSSKIGCRINNQKRHNFIWLVAESQSDFRDMNYAWQSNHHQQSKGSDNEFAVIPMLTACNLYILTSVSPSNRFLFLHSVRGNGIAAFSSAFWGCQQPVSLRVLMRWGQVRPSYSPSGSENWQWNTHTSTYIHIHKPICTHTHRYTYIYIHTLHRHTYVCTMNRGLMGKPSINSMNNLNFRRDFLKAAVWTGPDWIPQDAWFIWFEPFLKYGERAEVFETLNPKWL